MIAKYRLELPLFVGLERVRPGCFGNACSQAFRNRLAHRPCDRRDLHAAGVPPDVFFSPHRPRRHGSLLVEQPSTRFFTGSLPHGRAHRRGLRAAHSEAAAGTGRQGSQLRREDADVKTAAESLADGAMYNAGKAAARWERIYVHESIYERFVDAFVAVVKGYKCGDPLDEATTSARSRGAAAGGAASNRLRTP